MQTLFITGTAPSSGKTLLIKILAIYKQTYFCEESSGILDLIQEELEENKLPNNFLFSSPNKIKIVSRQLPRAATVTNSDDLCSNLLGKLWKTLSSLQKELDLVLIDGAESLSSPITREMLISDIVGIWDLPTILIVPIESNTINQAIANIALAVKNKVNLKGIVLNCTSPLVQERISQLAPIDLIQSLTNIPILGILPYIKDTEDAKELLSAASSIDLESLFY